MDSQHLTSEDLDNSLLTEWPIQKIFYFFTGEGNKAEKVNNDTAQFNAFLLFSVQTANYVSLTDNQNPKRDSVIEFKLVFYAYFVSTDKKTQEDIQVPHLRPEVLDTIRMEDLIKEHLTSKENVSREIKHNIFTSNGKTAKMKLLLFVFSCLL